MEAKTLRESRALHENDVDPDPLVQFGRWFEEARHAGLVEPTAMTLATASRDGVPSARMVLLKGYDPRGFVFFTNYGSAKGRDLAGNPRAALVFWWGALERQVRITGTVSRVADAESDGYFLSRPEGSRIAAAASLQSTVLSSREELDRRVEELARRYAGRPVPRPSNWGGYRVSPETMEFWQGRANRLHDRLRYVRGADANWKLERLSP